MTVGMSTLAGGVGVQIIASDQAPSAQVIDPTDATATYELTSAGDERISAGTGTVTDVGDWLRPKVGISNYDVMMTNNSGTAPTGPALGAWHNLGSTRSWVVTRTTIGTNTSNNTVQIRNSSTGTVLKTVSVVFTAQVD